MSLLGAPVTERWLYEVKPFENVIACLREATSQLLEYSYRFARSKPTNLVIVGPRHLKGEAADFFDHFVFTQY
jgi:hypothetical protein